MPVWIGVGIQAINLFKQYVEKYEHVRLIARMRILRMQRLGRITH
jgi:hypothetical protein